MKENLKAHYGYTIVGACFLIMTLAYGAQNAFGVFFKPMAKDFGWDRAETSGPFALYVVLSGLLGIFSGRLSDRFGSRKVVSAGGVILGAGYLLMSLIGNLWQLYVFYGILVAVGLSAIYIPLVTMIAKWFTARRGLMSGIGISGIGFGIAVVPSLASQLVVRYQWRVPLLVIGGIIFIFIPLLAQLLKNAPETAAEPIQPENHAGRELKINEGFSLPEALKTAQFWMIFVAWFFYGFFYQIGMVHIVPHATDLGMSAIAAATILTTIGLIGTAGRISQGFISDRLGIKNTVIGSYALMGLAYIGLATSHAIVMLYVFAVIFGALFGIGILLIPMVAEYFGFKALGVISGILIFSNSVGGAVGPPVAGVIYDARGSYSPAFLLCAATGLAAGLIILLIKPISRRPQN
ncbi:MAG TPA: MFS transporter [Dehalococcoidales bacterium]|nr:MFS transporter [Dehalococcoidales bacterium]